MLSLNGLKLVHVFKSRSMFLVKLGELKLGTYMFMIVMYFWLTISLVRMKCTSLSLLIIFCLKSILSDIKIPIELLPDPLELEFICQPFYSKLLSIFKDKIYFWYTEDRYCFLIQSSSLYLLTRELRSPIFKVITEIYVLIIVKCCEIFTFVVCIPRSTLCFRKYGFVFLPTVHGYANSFLFSWKC